MMELQESKREKEKEKGSKEEMREGQGGLRKAKLPPSAYVDRLLSCSILAAIQSEAKMSLILSHCGLSVHCDATLTPGQRQSVMRLSARAPKNSTVREYSQERERWRLPAIHRVVCTYIRQGHLR